ncbi:MAG: signal peptidase I [Candidatus Sumerlaeaceae bacterium]|nr:signal peptidase I [Candidatus Sumerlaeaceae bacterium]
MRVCPVCDFRNTDTSTRCLKCNALLVHDEAEVKKSLRQADRDRESDLALIARGTLERLWRRNPLRRYWALPENLPYRFPFGAGLLSIVPGLGQCYNHQLAKAALFAAAWAALLALCIATFFEPYSNFLLLTLLLLHLFIWNDAVVTAVRINGQQWSARNSIAMWFALLFFAGIFFTGIQYLLPVLILMILLLWATVARSVKWLDRNHWSTRASAILIGGAIVFALIGFLATSTRNSNLFSLVRVFKSSSAPVIKAGDLVLVNHAAFFLREPRLGEIIYFDPPRFSIECPGFQSNVYSVNIRDYFQRICGLPGDRLAVRNGRLWRNGAELPDSLQPIGVEQLPPWEFSVPEGHYFAPVTAIPDDLLVQGMHGVGGLSLTGGCILKGYDAATAVPLTAIKGRAEAILNPPPRRQRLK